MDLQPTLIPCPACGKPITIPITLTTEYGSITPGSIAVRMEADEQPLRDHLAECSATIT